MATQLKTLRLDSKGKSSEKMKQAVNELEYLTIFNRSISQAMARTMQDLSKGVFINMANFTLARRDSYLDYLHAGVKQDTVNALRMSPVHLNALFPEQLIAKAEEEISKSEERHSSGTSHRQQNRFHPYPASDKSTGHHDRKSTLPAWKQIKDKQQARKGRGNYHNSAKQSFLVEALYQLINKNAVEPVDNQNSLGFYNRLFLVPKPNNWWRPVLDLSTLNTFLNTESFKMETPETIRTSLQAGEWVTSIDFKHAYFHIPIHSQSRKYMRFHLHYLI